MLRLANSLSITRNKIASLTVCRCITSSTSSSSVRAVIAVPPAKRDWNHVVSEAEKIVGYPSSFLGIRWLLNDEVANVALHLRKLIGSNHPILKTAKNLIQDDSSNTQAWGLIVLLLSKAAGHAASFAEDEFVDKCAGVLHKQRALAEICEMIRLSQLVHQGIVNLQSLENAGNNLPSDSDIIFGNKIALLGGDYLLGSACQALGDLRNSSIQELMSTVVKDIAESNFIGDRDDQNNPLPSNPFLKIHVDSLTPLDDFNSYNNYVETDEIMGYPEREWAYRHTLSSASLLGKSCQGTLMLAGHSEPFQKQGYLFGKHLALAWQANMDLESFRLKTLPYKSSLSLIGAPVLFHLEHEPSLYREIKKGLNSVDMIDYQKIYDAVLEGPGIEKTKDLQLRHVNIAMNVLNSMPSCDAKIALQNIIVAILDN